MSKKCLTLSLLINLPAVITALHCDNTPKGTPKVPGLFVSISALRQLLNPPCNCLRIQGCRISVQADKTADCLFIHHFCFRTKLISNLCSKPIVKLLSESCDFLRFRSNPRCLVTTCLIQIKLWQQIGDGAFDLFLKVLYNHSVSRLLRMNLVTIFCHFHPGIPGRITAFYHFQFPDCCQKLFFVKGNACCHLIRIRLPEHPWPQKTVLSPFCLPDRICLIISYAQIFRLHFLNLRLTPLKYKLIFFRLL